MTATERWDEAYDRLGVSGVGWHQEEPVVSLELLDAIAPSAGDPVIDVGAGAARLLERLMARGMSDLTALDVSARALEARRGRLGPGGDAIHHIHADLLRWTAGRRYAVWHDRAVFHFLVDEGERRRYVAALHAALRPGGHAIIGTFALDGPRQCSGLPVARYDADGLAWALGPGFALVGSRREHHTTPSGRDQPFTWITLRREP